MDTMKKTLSLLLCLSLLLSGCGKKEVPPATESVPIPQVTPEIQAEPVAPDLNEQYLCIANHSDTWLEPSAEYEQRQYTVTDLDNNGRLEVICTACIGTGLYSVSHFYEVNPDCTDLTPLAYGVNEGDSEPDLCYTSVTSYSNGAQTWYLFDDVIRNGAAEHITVRYALCKQADTIEVQPVRAVHTVYNSVGSGQEISEYSDGSGTELTYAQYADAESQRFAGCSMTMKALEWFNLDPQSDFELFAEQAYWMFSMYDVSESPDFQVNVYTRPGSKEFEALGIETDFLNGCEYSNTVLRFTADTEVEIALEWGELLYEFSYFHPISEIFHITAKPGVVYEFPAILAEGIPEYRLKATRMGRCAVWYLLDSNYRYDDSDVIEMRYLESQPLLPGEHDPILSVCQAYAGFITAAGTPENMQEINYFWKAVGNAVLLQTFHNGEPDEYGRVFLPEWMMDAYLHTMFPYGYTWRSPNGSGPVNYSEERYERYMIADGLYFDDGSTQIDSVEFDDYGQIRVSVSVWTQIGQQYVTVYLAPDYDAGSENPFRYIITGADIAKG